MRNRYMMSSVRFAVGRKRLVVPAWTIGVCIGVLSVGLTGCGQAVSPAPDTQGPGLTLDEVRSGEKKSHNGSPATEGLRAKLSAHRTRIVGIRPTTTTGELIRGYRIVATSNGLCHTGSSVVTADVYGCTVGNEIAQPCWPNSQRDAVYCLFKPWLHEVEEIRVEGTLPPAGRAEGGALSWGLELTSGRRCETSRGATSMYRGEVVRFRCGGGVDLLEQPVRNTGLWRIREVRYSRRSGLFTYGAEVHVAVAWYGVANGGPRPPV
jgi:hypothetical protein